MERIPASERTREKLKAVIEGTEKGAGASELVRLAARLIIEEALEGEACDVLGREYYARGAAPGAGYRNGYRTGRLDSAEGRIEYSAPHRSARRFVSSCAAAPPSWRHWRWRCTRAGCRRAISRHCLPMPRARVC